MTTPSKYANQYATRRKKKAMQQRPFCSHGKSDKPHFWTGWAATNARAIFGKIYAVEIIGQRKTCRWEVNTFRERVELSLRLQLSYEPRRCGEHPTDKNVLGRGKKDLCRNLCATFRAVPGNDMLQGTPLMTMTRDMRVATAPSMRRVYSTPIGAHKR